MIELSLVENLTSIDIHIHFYFKETNIHSMDAVIFNECERQFINAVKNINKYLKEPIDIQVFAKNEGGLIENLKIVINHKLTQKIVIVIVACFCTAFFTVQFRQKQPLSEEVKNKLENVLAIKEAIASDALTEEEFLYIASNDKELLKFRSGFFKTAKKDETLTQIEIDTDTKIVDKYVFDKISVPYEKFDDFILKDDDIEEITNISEEVVKIHIIAPILVKGRKDHWKGFCNGESIDFILSDKDFLEQVYLHEIKFGNGSFVKCKLRTTITNKGNEKELITREVIFVENYGDDEIFVTPIKHSKKKIEENDQGLLAFDEEGRY